MNEETTWVRIERDFDAPITLVWRMWTDPALFKKWYGPNGMSIPTAEMDVRIGGIRKICMTMQSPDREMEMWFTGVYKEVRPPNRLVYTESICDADGKIISPQAMGMPDGFPDVTEVVIDLVEVDEKTRMVMVHIGVEEGTAGAGGWNQAFDKMNTLVRSLTGATP